uniref:Uncharacterized protein n=1 Tax=Octopus bimaculoides TaxID=37653 RepID=A0A0L8HR61_OCTBM
MDLDTLPAHYNIWEASKSIELLALDEIVTEMISSDTKLVITYSGDGSKKQGARSYSVPGLTIDGHYRLLPIPLEASEARNNLADLKVAVHLLLEAANQTSHNVGVEEVIAGNLSTEHIPEHLFRNSWNKVNEFDMLIQPWVNKFVALKNECFNHPILTCTITLYHLDYVTLYLAKYEHVTNQLACIDDLSTVDPNQLLNVHSPALNFVSSGRFQETRYNEDICCAVEAIATELKPEVFKSTVMASSKVSRWFPEPEGSSVSFWKHHQSLHALANMDLTKLESHNLDSECSVGFTNELSR